MRSVNQRVRSDPQVTAPASTIVADLFQRGTLPLVRRTALGAVLAGAADLVAFGAARAFAEVPAGFVMLNPVSIIAAAAGASVAAGVGMAVLRRFTRRANANFLVAAAAVTVLSLAGPFQAMAGAMPGAPRATLATGTTMIVMHFLTAGIIAWALVRPRRGGR